MIRPAQSSAANYLAPIVSGHGNAVQQLAAQQPEFSNLLGAGQASSAASLGATATTKQLGETLNLQSLQGMQTPPTIHGDQDPAAVNESTLNGKMPEEQPATAEEALTQFVGETFYGMMIKQMRSSVIQSDLMGNSNAQKMFESQFDQMMVERLAENSSSSLSQPMYEQMMRMQNPS